MKLAYLCFLLLAPLCSVWSRNVDSAAGISRTASEKKGVGYWSCDGSHHGLNGSGVRWCYDWGTAPVGQPFAGIEFIPMIWDKSRVTAAELALAKKSGRTLLAFNEPDASNQANMTVGEALALWPQLQATGMRLGSPAPTSNGALPGKWLDAFVQGIRERGLRLDFFCVHYYSARFDDPKAATAELKDFLTQVYHRYRMPIWLTEFALSNWKTPATSEEQRSYIKEAVPMLEALPFVGRYAWFAFPRFTGDKNALANSHLINDAYQLNPSGVAYRDSK